MDGISLSFGDRRVLTDVSLVVSSGERAALIGENGSGKSTLLRVAASLLTPDVGSVHAPGVVGLFHQEPPFAPSLRLDGVLADATGHLRSLTRAVERASAALGDGIAGAATELDLALEAARRAGAWDVEQRTHRVVEGLGLTHLPRDRPAGELSGGQRSRLSLAWMLLRSPDTLLLDEPTNHLDDAGTALLVDLLSTWSGPVLIASHDRAFLDESATTLLDLDPAPMPRTGVPSLDDGREQEEDRRRVVTAEPSGSGYGLTRFTGSYTAYLQHRRAVRRRWVQRYQEEQGELQRLRARVRADQRVGHADRPPRTESRISRKFYSDRNATVVARRVNDARTALERLEAAQVRRPSARLRFRGLGALARHRPEGQGPLLVAQDLSHTTRLTPVSLTLRPDSRLLVTGANGSGKSTLLRLLAGDLAPTGGSVTRAPTGSVALLSQEPLTREPDSTASEVYAAAIGAQRADRYPLSGLGLLAARDLDQRWRDLSVGQRRRLDLAIVLADPPAVLLLDEPTNHLSLLLVSELELSLPDYPGAVVVASHDRWLREDWVGERLELGEGTLSR
ncbi:ABC-F family ATP-binding cassette domain-containing protein [Serinicoccus profundi]|uniref:ABC-F family ATP-binding cassette domain-containing protein n=1 Tax=Serinicoccus profundi TaxID=1078471 RepID=UPI000255E424|nr:ABC-F family ATP-binding cassette domain-containing protein [Serinicoccus profundi]